MTPNFSFILYFYSILLFLCLHSTYASKELNKNYWKLPLAGGLAGGVTNAIIFPLDTIKTMMQTNSKLNNLESISNYLSKKGISKIYSGFIPAVVGAIPSSALYFGTYEGIKRFLKKKSNWNRQLIHVISAASGNLASSFIFVPKEAIKQQLQAFKTGSLQSSTSSLSTYSISKYIFQKSGIRGFYPSYFATLSRNVPSAIIRFAIFEEFKILGKKFYGDKFEDTRNLFSGAVASGIASGLTTPFDVVKTRLATGILPPGSPIFQSIVHIAQKEGFNSLYAGFGPRLLWSALYGGIGLTCFEKIKKYLDIQE